MSENSVLFYFWSTSEDEYVLKVNVISINKRKTDWSLTFYIVQLWHYICQGYRYVPVEIRDIYWLTASDRKTNTAIKKKKKIDIKTEYLNPQKKGDLTWKYTWQKYCRGCFKVKSFNICMKPDSSSKDEEQGPTAGSTDGPADVFKWVTFRVVLGSFHFSLLSILVFSLLHSLLKRRD